MLGEPSVGGDHGSQEGAAGNRPRGDQLVDIALHRGEARAHRKCARDVGGIAVQLAPGVDQQEIARRLASFSPPRGAQRGYQANGKTITVSDELMSDTLNLKR